MYGELVEYLTICTIIVVLFFVDVFFFTHIRKFKGWFFNKTRIKKKMCVSLSSISSLLLFYDYSILISFNFLVDSRFDFFHVSVNSNFINDVAIFGFG